jgi:hypothetical protein
MQRILIAMLLAGGLVAALVAFGADKTDPVNAADPQHPTPARIEQQQLQPVPVSQSNYDSPPCACPLWVVGSYPTSNGTYHLYYSEFFQESCQEEPQITGLFGQYDLSPGCDAYCVQGFQHCCGSCRNLLRLKTANPQPFPGLAGVHPVGGIAPPWDLLVGMDKEYSYPVKDSEIDFVDFKTGSASSPVYRRAKVYSFVLDMQARYRSKERKRIIYIGLEVNPLLPIGSATHPEGEAEEIHEVANNGVCYLHRVTIKKRYGSDTQPGSTSILVLLAGP